MKWRFLTFPDKAAAQARSAAALEAKYGRPPIPGNTARYLWPISVNEETGRATVAIDEDEDAGKLTQAERGRLKTEKQAEAAKDKAAKRLGGRPRDERDDKPAKVRRVIHGD